MTVGCCCWLLLLAVLFDVAIIVFATSAVVRVQSKKIDAPDTVVVLSILRFSIPRPSPPIALLLRAWQSSHCQFIFCVYYSDDFFRDNFVVSHSHPQSTQPSLNWITAIIVCVLLHRIRNRRTFCCAGQQQKSFCDFRPLLFHSNRFLWMERRHSVVAR